MSMSRDEAKTRLKDLTDAMRVLDHAKEPLQKEFTELYRGLSDATARRIKAGDTFSLDELTFAATSRCECGSGLAYANDIGVHGFWDCSAILLGVADKLVKHTGQLPFSFYEIKSEGQPSANGATTRPSLLA